MITTTSGRTQLWMGPKMHKLLTPDVGLKDLIISNLIASWPIPKLSLLAHLMPYLKQRESRKLVLWPCHLQCTGLYGLADMFFILEHQATLGFLVERRQPPFRRMQDGRSRPDLQTVACNLQFQETETSSSRLSASLKAGSCSGNLPNMGTLFTKRVFVHEASLASSMGMLPLATVFFFLFFPTLW